MGGRKISPELVTLDLVYVTAMTAWLILFFVQSLLISARKVRAANEIWVGPATVALVASGTGFMVAVQSVRPVPAIPFLGHGLTGSS